MTGTMYQVELARLPDGRWSLVRYMPGAEISWWVISCAADPGEGWEVTARSDEEAWVAMRRLAYLYDEDR